jgi:hypothetical protein
MHQHAMHESTARAYSFNLFFRNYITLTIMKKIILVAALLGFIIASCNTASSNAGDQKDCESQSECAHEHADSKCQDQEVFEVKADSTHECSHDSTAVGGVHEHTHGEGHQH